MTWIDSQLKILKMDQCTHTVYRPHKIWYIPQWNPFKMLMDVYGLSVHDSLMNEKKEVKNKTY